MEVLALGVVKNGKLELQNSKKFAEELKIFEGDNVLLTLEKKKRKRSNQQSRYYWGVVIPSVKYAMEAKGFFINNKEQVHLLMKVKFLKAEIINVATGEVIETIGSTTRLSTIDFESYLEQIRAWSASYLDCIVALPNEQTEIFNN
jgi:hypothetical protein